MKANPAVAAAAFEQAKAVMATPGMAEGMLAAQRAGPGFQAAIASLKDDPELAPIFSEIASGGLGAVQKHWDDAELMAKISRKMEEMRVAEGGGSVLDAPPTPSHGEDGEEAAVPAEKAVKGGAAVPAPAPSTPLHAAAKAGDVAAVKELLSTPNANPDARDARGITPLGTAVGFNRSEVVDALLAGGAAVDGTDGKGNTALHYAAGYGRIDLVKALLAAGADPGATNGAGQTPADAARTNGEKKAVKILEAASAKAVEDKGAFVSV